MERQGIGDCWYLHVEEKDCGLQSARSKTGRILTNQAGLGARSREGREVLDHGMRHTYAF